jgi:hypothetical protein
MVRNVLFGAVVVLLVLSLAALSVTIWWAKTVVATARTELWVERENVRALNEYAGIVKEALDARTAELESLRAECCPSAA